MRPAQNHFELPIYLGRVHVATPEHEKQSTATTGNRPIEDALDYFRTIAGVDENVGRVLDTLDQAGLAEDTLVIYASDNGYHLREKGIGDKRSAYEVSMRIPMLLRYPRAVRAGQINDAMVLNMDVAPTLLEFAGIPIPKAVQGRSWKPMLDGHQKRVRDAFLYEYFFSYGDITDYEAQTADPPITPNIVAVRTEDAKLIKYPGRTWVELFDLRKDPYERRNVAEESDYRELRQRMETFLDQQIKQTGFRIPEKAKHIPTEGLETWRK
jgi:arylsulfatase A-like enzyme